MSHPGNHAARAATAAPSRRALLLAAAASACGAGAAAAQTRFPERAVRIVVPYAVGVGPDVVARALAERLTRAWAQTVYVDNKPGASGILAFADVRRVPPDGHTLYLADAGTMCMNPLLHDHLPYDAARDLAPLTLLFRATFVVMVGGASRFASLAQLLEAARQPGKVSYASLGHGHPSQVAVETLARAAGVQLLHVPFKDAGALLTAVASADVDFTTFSMNTVAGLVQRGRIRPLAVAARQRLAEHPDLPTLAEAGGPDLELRPWAGLVTSAAVPEAVQTRLQQDLYAAIDTAELRARTQPLGFELIPSTARQMRERVEADSATYAPLVREGRVAKV